MSHIVALDSTSHRELRIDPKRVEALGCSERMVPVVLDEFLKLIVHYPIVFTKNAESGQFVCCALLGFDANENLFWQDDQWDGVYTPMSVSRQPFFIGDNNGQPVVCIDTDSNAVTDEGGEALFTPDGGESDYFIGIKQTLAALSDSEKHTREFIDTLLELKLLTPMQLSIEFADGQKRQVQGLYTIDEDRLNALDVSQREDLFARGYNKPIYTAIASLGQIYALIDRKNRRLQNRD